MASTRHRGGALSLAEQVVADHRFVDELVRTGRLLPAQADGLAEFLTQLDVDAAHRAAQARAACIAHLAKALGG